LVEGTLFAGKSLFRFFNALHIFLYRRTRGRVGSNVQGLPILLLSTIGRRSGKTRVTPLGYFEHEGSYIVIASNAGFDRHPGWFHNLKSQPRVTIEVGDRVMEAGARVVGPDAYKHLWSKLVSLSPGYARYAERTRRVIPIVSLRPLPLSA
jgi:deazaflavin-dependent oxidoreductase (nitroreductase family)